MATKITGTVSGDPLIEVEIGGVFVPWKQGIQNWASVTAVTGSPTSGTYTDANNVTWKFYQWTGNGSVTVTAGIVDALIVSGGGGSNSAVAHGHGGAWQRGVTQLSAGTSTVTVGAGGAGSQSVNSSSGRGAASSIGSWSTQRGLMGNQDSNPSLTDDITGTSLTYALGDQSSPRANRGDGGFNNAAGSSGVVIIRVPSSFALV